MDPLCLKGHAFSNRADSMFIVLQREVDVQWLKIQSLSNYLLCSKMTKEDPYSLVDFIESIVHRGVMF